MRFHVKIDSGMTKIVQGRPCRSPIRYTPQHG
jgi:hypothetical protein